MAMQIFDKLCMLNNIKKETGADELTDYEVAQQGDEILKYLSFLEGLCFNSINLTCIKQIQG